MSFLFYHISFFISRYLLLIIYIYYLLFILSFLYSILARGPFYFKSNLRPIWELFFCSHQPTLGPIYSLGNPGPKAHFSRLHQRQANRPNCSTHHRPNCCPCGPDPFLFFFPLNALPRAVCNLAHFCPARMPCLPTLCHSQPV